MHKSKLKKKRKFQDNYIARTEAGNARPTRQPLRLVIAKLTDRHNNYIYIILLKNYEKTISTIEKSLSELRKMDGLNDTPLESNIEITYTPT